MNKLSNVNKAKYSFYILILFSIIWTIFVPKPLKNYSPIFLGLSFGILFFLYFDGVMNLSILFRNKYPELFKKYVGRHDLVDVYNLIKSDDYDKLYNDEIKLKVKLITLFFKLSIMSFLLSIIFGIIIINF